MVASTSPLTPHLSAEAARTVPGPERKAAARIAALLSSARMDERNAVVVTDTRGERIEIPHTLTAIIQRVAELLAEGHPVAVVSDDEVLTTREAAELLNVSRQYLVRLVDGGELPAHSVGSHRRLRLGDVLDYKARRDARRTSALDRLAALSEDAGGYELGGKSE